MNLLRCGPLAAAAVFLPLCFTSSVSAQSAPTEPRLNSATPATPGSSLILPGDRISLRVWRERDWSGEFDIDDRGIAVLPRLGPIHVSGLTVDQARTLLSERFAEYLVTPAVEVRILRRIAVHGEVNEPTLYWVDLTMTVRDAVALAGGLTPFGDPRRISIRRGTTEVEVGEAVSVAEAASGLQSGDQIVVGRRNWFSLNTPFVVSTVVSVTSVLVGFLIAK